MFATAGVFPFLPLRAIVGGGLWCEVAIVEKWQLDNGQSVIKVMISESGE